MYKNKILSIIFLFLFSTLTAQNNTGIVYYKVIKDTTYQKIDNFIVENKINSTFEIAKDFLYELKFNTYESLYKMQDDMPDENVSKIDFIMATLLGGDGEFYQNRKENVIIHKYKEVGVTTCEAKLLMQNWNIDNKIYELSGLNVYKASKNGITAWFTPEIPVPFGPRGEGGLPGLILQLKIGIRIITATRIKFNNDITIDFKKCKEIKKNEKLKAKRLQFMNN